MQVVEDQSHTIDANDHARHAWALGIAYIGKKNSTIVRPWKGKTVPGMRRLLEARMNATDAGP